MHFTKFMTLSSPLHCDNLNRIVYGLANLVFYLDTPGNHNNNLVFYFGANTLTSNI